MNIMNSIKKYVRRSSLIIMAAATLSACNHNGKKIDPIGWYDFNNDGVKDAIVLLVDKISGYDKKNNQTTYYKQLTWLDGKRIYDPDGVREFASDGTEINPNLHFNGGILESRLLHDSYVIDNTYGEDSNYQRIAIVSDVNNDLKLDIELYTRTLTDSNFKCDKFYTINK